MKKITIEIPIKRKKERTNCNSIQKRITSQ